MNCIETTSLLSSILLAATSIYLSGNYDYDMVTWRSMAIEIPTLSFEALEEKWQTIVQTAKANLSERTFSPLLLLYPLRVAGARAWTEERQKTIEDLLNKVGDEFVVAKTFLEDLRELWKWRNEHASDNAKAITDSA
jgi:hypothetical protein